MNIAKIYEQNWRACHFAARYLTKKKNRETFTSPPAHQIIIY